MTSPDGASRRKLLLARAPTGIAASALLAVVAFSMIWGTLRSTTGAVALGLFLALAVVRGVAIALYAKSGNGVLLRLFLAATVAAAAVWGIPLGVLLATRGMEREVLFVLLPTAGICAGLASTFASQPRVARAFLALMLAPAIVGVACSHEPLGTRIGIAINIGLFLAFKLVEVARRYAELLREEAGLVALEQHAAALDLARVEALDASRAKSQFLANMSHEIRTPLTAILGYAELLEDRDVTPSDRLAHARTIRKSGTHLLNIVGDVLDFAKADAGKLKIDVAPCSPVAILNEVVGTMRARAAERGLILELRSDGPLPSRIASDAVRVKQILMNLVGNAIKFTDAGYVCVVAKCEERVGRAPTLAVSIIDSGIGIDAGLRERLFTSFSQADGSTTRRHGGTGLGLAISRQLAQLMRGELTYAPNDGPGSTFRLVIPTGSLDGVAWVNDLHGGTEDSMKGRRLGPAAAVLRASVLVAEDFAENRKLITRLLESAGAKVEGAENGRQAVAMARAAWEAGNPFDVVLMDMEMPEVDGIEATQMLRAQGYDGAIVALTAHAFDGQRAKCLEAGCNGFVTKPVTKMDLVTAVTLHAKRSGVVSTSALRAAPKTAA
jgi:signal transduction histidine kinase/AmiR/NasT family two-component response regulator